MQGARHPADWNWCMKINVKSGCHLMRSVISLTSVDGTYTSNQTSITTCTSMAPNPNQGAIKSSDIIMVKRCSLKDKLVANWNNNLLFEFLSDTKGGFYVIKNDRGNTSNLKSFTDRKIKITNTDFVACVRYNLLDDKSDLVKCQSEKQKIPFLGAIDRNATNSKSTVLKFPRRGHTSEQNYTCNCTVPGIWSDDDAATVTVCN